MKTFILELLNDEDNFKLIKNKKRGFTLVELLAVIAVLAIILVIAYPRINNMLEAQKAKAYFLDEQAMKDATENLAETGDVVLPTTIMETKEVSLGELIAANKITPVVDKDDGTECDPDDTYITIVKTGDRSYEYIPHLKCNTYETEYIPINYINDEDHITSIPGGYTGIYTIEDLYDIRNDYNGNYILMNDLDFNSDDSYNDPLNKNAYITGTGWTPIGDSVDYFFGVFDGNNYSIDNLYINNETGDRCGLFGVVSGTIKNIGLTNLQITCDNRTGGIVGSLQTGIVENSYVNGNIEGDYRIGGIVGNNYGTSRISNTYMSGSLTARESLGGIAGYVYDSIVENSLSAADMTAETAAGAIHGYTNTGVYNNNYRNKDAVSVNISNVNSKTITEVWSKSAIFIMYDLGWDIEDIWTLNALGYPTLGGTVNIFNPEVDTSIETVEDLYGMKLDMSGTYDLMNDLDFDNRIYYEDMNNMIAFISEEGFEPVGDSNVKFTGNFNGNSYTINNLYINKPNQHNVGLFGQFEGGTISKVGLIDVDVTGRWATGALGGYVGTATVGDCYSTGTVVGDQKVGGLVGDLGYATINNSYSTADVTGNNSVGGLSGTLWVSNIFRSFATGDVTSEADAGGFVGTLYSVEVTHCYRNLDATISPVSNEVGTLANIGDMQNLSLPGLTDWDTTNTWQINSGEYPTFK